MNNGMPPSPRPSPARPLLICFSHLRWNFVYQRPQHLLSRCAKERRVFYVEEPIFDAPTPRLAIDEHDGVHVVVPHLPEADEAQVSAMLRHLLDALLQRFAIVDYAAWFYTPMAVPWTSHLRPRATVYDCMDELTAFAGAPVSLRDNEQELLSIADVVFTGGQTLYEHKRHCHSNVHAFPSSVDVAHFAAARKKQHDPDDQAGIPHPRLGFFGVIDERLDIDLLGRVAALRPDWHLVVIGPIAKIDPASLPVASNIHYLGAKKYEELPSYLAGWDVALLPFARNEATRFISPTKTPEYLAAGKPVVSTSIRDVVRPYGQLGLVRIADEVPAFIRACTAAMHENATQRVTEADAFLRQTSWDGTWTRIRNLMDSIDRAADAPSVGEALGGATAV